MSKDKDRVRKVKAKQASKDRGKGPQMPPRRIITNSIDSLVPAPVVVPVPTPQAGAAGNPTQAGSSREPINRSTEPAGGSSAAEFPDRTQADPADPKRPHDTETSETDRKVKRRRKKMKTVLTYMDTENKSRRKVEALGPHHDQARFIGRAVNPFMSPLETLIFGMNYDGPVIISSDSDADSDSGSDDEEDTEQDKKARATERAHERELLYQYHATLDILPVLKASIATLDDAELGTISDYLLNHMTAARGDDSGRITDKVIIYMQCVDGPDDKYQRAPSELDKFQRGWHDWHTARLLCPQRQLPTFDEDWQRFCELVMSSAKKIKGGDLPCFLYDQQALDNTDESAGLLRSEYFLKVFKAMWTGPGSAGLAFGRKPRTPGKPPLALKYKLSKVTPRYLAYTAVLVRAELTSLRKWDALDAGEYDANDLFNAIVEQFEDTMSTWSIDTLAWWNLRVFGNIRAQGSVGGAPDEDTTADILRAKRRAARKAARAATAHDIPPPSTV